MEAVAVRRHAVIIGSPLISKGDAIRLTQFEYPVRFAVRHEQHALRERFIIREEKREKRNQVVLNTSIREVFEKYQAAYPDVEDDLEHFVFFSSTRSGPTYTRAISRVQAWRLIAEMCHSVGLVGNYGTHTLRKTWGYQARQSGVPLELIMAKLNHANIAMTKRYLGITDDELRAIAEGLNL